MSEIEKSKPVVERRLVRRCAMWNAKQGTDHTPETYDEERNSEYLRLVWWDAGWEACEEQIRALAEKFHREADDLKLHSGQRAFGASIAYEDMAAALESMFPPPNANMEAPNL